MNLTHRVGIWFLLCLLHLALELPCFALDPEPRNWSHLPMDKNFGGFAYARTKADIFFDPTLLVKDAELKLDTWAGKYIRTFELFGKSSSIDIIQAYQKGEWTGLLDGTPASVSRDGLADTLLRFSMNLYGAPPLRGQEFAVYRANTKKETIVGAALTVRIPTGNYLEDKLLNLGENRYTFRPQLGIVHTRGKWTTELTGEVALHTKNDEFYSGNTLEQKPLYFVHGHLIHTFRPGQWASVSVGYDYGDENRLNGVDKNDTKQDIGWKVSYVHPINRSIGIKFTYLGTYTQEPTGSDSDTLSVSTSFMW